MIPGKEAAHNRLIKKFSDPKFAECIAAAKVARVCERAYQQAYNDAMDTFSPEGWSTKPLISGIGHDTHPEHIKKMLRVLNHEFKNIAMSAFVAARPKRVTNSTMLDLYQLVKDGSL